MGIRVVITGAGSKQVLDWQQADQSHHQPSPQAGSWFVIVTHFLAVFPRDPDQAAGGISGIAQFHAVAVLRCGRVLKQRQRLFGEFAAVDHHADFGIQVSASADPGWRSR